MRSRTASVLTGASASRQGTENSVSTRACRLTGDQIGLGPDVITRIPRATWIAAHLVLLAASAYFAATIVSTMVRGRLGTARVARTNRATVVTPPSTVPPLEDYLSIARRDLFAAVPVGETGVAAEPARRGPASLKLIGTGRRGRRGYAIVEDTQAKRQDLVTVGAKLGDAEVVRIGQRQIVLKRGGEEEVLTVTSESPSGPAAGNAPASTAPATGGPTAATDDDQIRKLGDDRYLIARAEVDHSLENLSELFTQVRAVPNMQEGKTNGFRLFSIRRGSLFDKIGLQNNDVVQRINGIELNDPARAMTFFQELQGQARLSVDVLRGNEARTLNYEIR